MMPPEFRIIGTMNTQDKNTLFNVGHALMRRFAFVEIGLPDRDDEYRRMPVFVFNKLNKLGIAPDRPEGSENEDWYAKEMFDFYDDDGFLEFLWVVGCFPWALLGFWLFSWVLSVSLGSCGFVSVFLGMGGSAPISYTH